MTVKKLEIGRKGERLARDYLLKHGYQIRVQNYRTRNGEIDLIAEKQEDLFFVEVKYRSSLEFGFPQESVIRRKQKKIVRVATAFLKAEHLWDKVDCHFDVLALHEENGRVVIEHIKDAF
jgi:putative endonuclease